MRVIFITTTAPRRPMPKTKRAKAKQTHPPRWIGARCFPDPVGASAGSSTPKGKTPRLGARPNQITSPWLDKVRCLFPDDLLPRKEVIQPQLPLRLPCYDFVPITSPALDGCLPDGLAPRLQALPAFVT